MAGLVGYASSDEEDEQQTNVPVSRQFSHCQLTRLKLIVALILASRQEGGNTNSPAAKTREDFVTYPIFSEFRSSGTVTAYA
jgi:hypothetical protein